jgi:hypothetical protein
MPPEMSCRTNTQQLQTTGGLAIVVMRRDENVKQQNRNSSGMFERAMVPTKWIMRMRGAVKVILIAGAANETLNSVFMYVAQRIDPGLPPAAASVFSFATCALAGLWFQADARRAYLFARDRGYIARVDPSNRAPHIAANCPKRWLVVLYIELNPGLVGL